MYKIYCIEDINDLKYVGITNQKLNIRLSKHRYDKKKTNICSSQKLNLDNCIIYLLEKTNDSKREQYWINYIDCVNDLKLNFDRRQYNKQYYQNNKDEILEYHKQYNIKNKDYYKQHYIKNKDKRTDYQREYSQYQNSWGGDHRTNNNLLRIDIDYFS